MILRRALVGPLAAAVAIAASLVAAPAASAAPLSFVSGSGDDVNPCTRTAPCKTFAGAISKTDEGGTIVALDPGAFGAVTITKAITIDGSGVQSGILAFGTIAITVNAGATDAVVLRGLDISGGSTARATSTECSPNGLIGLRVLNAGSVLLDDSRIMGMSTAGVTVAPMAATSEVVIAHSVIRNTCGPAVQVAPAPGASASVQLVDATISANDVGVAAEQGARVLLLGTTLFGNGADTTTIGDATIDATDATNHLLAAAPIGKPNVSTAVGGATRTWVSGVGDDANPCSRTAPCRTFAGAITKTATGGEINVIDTGSYGPIVIGRAVTIDATGATGQVVAAGTDGIVVNVGPTEDVILRGLTIVGGPGADPACPYTGSAGVRIIGGRSVHVERSTISGFTTAGVAVVPTAAQTRVVVNQTVVSNVCGSGVAVAPVAGQAVPVLVRESSIINSGTGVAAASGGAVSLVRTDITATTVTTSTTGGTVTALPNARTPAPVVIEGPTRVVEVQVPAPIVQRAQAPVACKALPKRLKRSRTTVLLSHTCVTTGGQVVRVSVAGRGKLVRGSNGKRSVRTKRSGVVTITRSAPASELFLSFSEVRKYKL